MNRRMKWLLNRAKADETFVAIYRASDPKNRAPGMFADVIDQHLFCCIYMGYLLGTGNYAAMKKEYILIPA